MPSSRNASSTRKIPFMLKRSSSGESPAAQMESTLQIPSLFRCPISLDLMKDPVTLSTGITYDRESIETWMDIGRGTCPATNQALSSEEYLVPNHSLRKMMQDWCVANRSFGIERIPTPKIPVAPVQVEELLAEITVAARREDRGSCLELVRKIKYLGKESERNRRCIISGGAARVLSSSFSELAATRYLDSSSSTLKEEILSALVTFFPLDGEACRHIGSSKSLNSIVSILQSGSLAARSNAALVMRKLVSSLTPDRVEATANADGLIEALVKLIEKPISPQTTKAAMVTSYYLASSSEKTAGRLSETGLVSLLLDNLVDFDKSMSEKALAVLDSLFGSKRGREMAYGHALAVPVLVKKMLRVSDMATEFAVSAMGKICKIHRNELGGVERPGRCAVEALQVGAFQKLLLLLQVGCHGATKEKATELLKIFNSSRQGLECIESVDFKGLKRPF